MIRTLVVEDDDLTADAHAEYLRRIDGFEVAGIATTASAALSAIRASRTGEPIDLVLLDMNLPDGHGIELARHLRSGGVPIDIIAITAVRDLDVVHTAISVGIVQYLIKPFAFATFREKLENYAEYRRQLDAGSSATTQREVDTMLASLRAPVQVPLPKGLSEATLDAVSNHLKVSALPLSAIEVAGPLHLSRVTARRYLEQLAETSQVSRAPRYGTPGRPELEYHWGP